MQVDIDFSARCWRRHPCGAILLYRSHQRDPCRRCARSAGTSGIIASGVTLLWISETLASGRGLGRIDDPGKVPGIRDAGRIPGIEDPGEVPARYLWMRAWMAPPASISGSLIPGVKAGEKMHRRAGVKI